MTIEALFIRTRKSIGDIELDGIITETHVNTVELSRNPIELGADITDHAIIEPRILNILAIVSDSPLDEVEVGPIVNPTDRHFGTSTARNITRSVAAYNAIIEIMNRRDPIAVQTRLKLYENMLITNVSCTQDKDSSNIVSMDISLSEALIVSTQIVTLIPRAGIPSQLASPAVEEGRKEITTPPPQQEKSVAKAIGSWVL